MSSPATRFMEKPQELCSRPENYGEKPLASEDQRGNFLEVIDCVRTK
jgi:hypothetical protein